MHALTLSSALLFLLSAFSIDAAINKLPKGFSIDLIHRDSPLSPFYDPSLTPSELVLNAASRSMSRVKRLRRSMAETSVLSVETDIIPNDGSYLMNFFIGTPPVERWALADTGSDLIWVQCSPCPQCYPQKAPLFDPTSSSTYTGLSCNSTPCAALPRGYSKCGTSNECLYYYSYLDKSTTTGDLATESISFGASDNGGQAVSFPQTVFGCGHNNSGTYNSNNTGVVGLGQGALSLVSQMGNVSRKFSYCLPPFGVNSTAKLKFGEKANISGNGVASTPLITNPSFPSFYFLNLEGITIGQQTVQIGPNNGSIVIDSGSTLTYLPSNIYDQVEALVKNAIGANQSIVQNTSSLNPFKLCYTNVSSINNFPDFQVQFKGANLSLKPQNFFLPVTNDVVCFAMVPADSVGISIYGNVAQVNFDIEYDLDQRMVSFAPVDCTKQ